MAGRVVNLQTHCGHEECDADHALADFLCARCYRQGSDGLWLWIAELN